jgi:hypothetical protein
VFWALVPEAQTTAEKLMMTGEPVNISNIEKKIKDSIDTVTDSVRNLDLKAQGDKLKEGIDNVTENISEGVRNLDLPKRGNRLKSNSQNFFDGIGNILMFFLKVFAKFIGIILLVVGILTLVGLIVGFFTVGLSDLANVNGMEYIYAANSADVPIWILSLLAFIVIAVPFFFLFYLGLKILVTNLKSIGNIAKFTLLGVWLVAIIALSVIGIRTATEFSVEGKVSKTENLMVKPNDTLRLQMTSFNNYDNYYYRSRGQSTKVTRSNNKNMIVSSDIRLIVRSTKDSLGSIIVEKSARGSNFDVAEARAENIEYNYELKNGELRLDNQITTDLKNKFSDQEITVIVYLPEGSILFADENTSSFHYNSSYYNDILERGMEEQYMLVEDGKLTCLDCENEEDEEANISITTDKLNVNVSETVMDAEPNNIEVTIDEEEGVQITSGGNDNY